MSLRRTAICRCLPLDFTRLMRTCESERTERELIPQWRAEIMAFCVIKISAISGDVTKDEVAEWEEDDSASSMIQASPAHIIEGFQAASVYMRVRFGSRVGSWLMRSTVNRDLGRGSWEEAHSLASRVALSKVSVGVKSLFWKNNWFLEIHKF